MSASFVCSRCNNRFATWSARCSNCFEYAIKPYQEQVLSNLVGPPALELPAPTAGRDLVLLAGGGDSSALAAAVARAASAPLAVVEALEPKNRPQPITAVKRETFVRFPVGIDGIDKVFGGGLVAQSSIALVALPGMGKSTIGLQILHRLVSRMRALYVTNEETVAQVADRAARLQTMSPDMFIIREDNAERIIQCAKDLEVGILLIDSLQTIYSDSIPSKSKVTQAPVCAKLLADFGKSLSGPIIFLICQVTQDGSLAGPNSVAHYVDVIVELAMFNDREDQRVFQPDGKNRFGNTAVRCKLRMTDDGLVEIKDPPLDPNAPPSDDDPDEPGYH